MTKYIPMSLFSIFLISLIWGNAHAAKGTTDLLLEISVAVRGVDLTEGQKALLDNAIASTKKLPDVTANTKKSFKQAISETIDRRDATFSELSNVLISHYEGRLKETVMGHHEIATNWAKFDASLDDKQRLNFRERMAPTINKTFSAMTKNSINLAKIENLSTDEYVRKLALSESQEKLAGNLYQDALSKLASLGQKGDEINRKIGKALSDPTVDFMEIPDAMLEYFNVLTSAITVRRDYGNAIHQILNEDQQRQLTEIIRSKLRMLHSFL